MQIGIEKPLRYRHEHKFIEAKIYPTVSLFQK